MKILFIGLNWLGDVVMSLPAMIAAAEKHEVHVLTRPNLAEIYHLTNCFSGIHKIATNGPILTGIRKISQLKTEEFDKIVVLPDSIRAAIISWICVGDSIGYNTQSRKMFLTRAIEKPENFKEIHESRLHFDLVKASGIASEISPLPHLEFSQADWQAVSDRLGLDGEKTFYILAPGAAFGAAKRWPAESFARLAKMLSEKENAQILVTGSNSEKEIAESIVYGKATKSIAGMTSLRELAMVISKAKAMVANDSGTMHLAALFGTPTIVPVGPTDMVRTGSLSKNVRYIYGSEKCPDAPCRMKLCHRDDHICMRSITAKMVLSAIENLEGTNK